MNPYLLRVCVTALFFTTALQAQTSDFLWTRQVAGVGSDLPMQIATDGFGNEYVAGWFDSPALTCATTTLTINNYSSHMFLIKYDFAGNEIWARQVGAVNPNDYNHVRARGVCCDPSGNVFVIGTFSCLSVQFGTTTLTNWGNPSPVDEIFIAKYDQQGNVLWTKAIHGIQGKSANSVAADALGNIYVTGEFYGPTISFGSTTVSNPGSPWDEIFLAKYDASGNLLWAKAEGGMDHDYGAAVAVDANNNVLLTGHIGSIQVIIGSDTLSNPSDPTYDLLTAKFSPSGVPLWARSMGGASYEVGKTIACDQNGNVVVGGYMQSPSASFASTNISNPFAPFDCYLLMKYDSTGNELWVRSGGLTDNMLINDIALDVADNICLCGRFDDSLVTIGANTQVCQGQYDILVAKFDQMGNAIWSKGIGNSLHEEAMSLCIDYGGSIYFTGYFMSYQIYFGTTLLTNSFNPCTSGEIFVSALDYTTGEFMEESSTVTLYPNPSGGHFAIGGISESFDYTIHAVTGEALCSGKQQSPNVPINVSDLAPGMYLVEIHTASGISAKSKFIR
jgi:hypothetical protein